MYINREDTNYNIEVEIFQNQYNQFKSNKIIIPTLFIFFFVYYIIDHIEYRLYVNDYFMQPYLSIRIRSNSSIRGKNFEEERNTHGG